MVSNVKSLTSGVGELVKKVDDLYASLSKVNTVAGQALNSASSAVGTVGGQYGLGQGPSRPGTGADNAHFPAAMPATAPSGNFMENSLGKFSGYSPFGQYPTYFPNSPQYPGMPGGGGGGGGIGAALFGMTPLGRGINITKGIGQTVLGVAAGAYAGMPGVSDTLSRTYGYYQAALKVPGISRNELERATFSAMGGGLSAVGSDAQVASILASMGYTAGSQNYLQAVGQVGGAFKYLGMENTAAAQAVAGFQTGPMGANLFQYGITTTDVATGKEKTPGQLAKELMNLMSGGRTDITAEDVRKSYQKGALGANLGSMGFSPEQQQMLYQAMIDLASGRDPDLATASPMAGNENTFLTAQGRVNASQTELMTIAEERMIKGFENAADTVEAFNRVLGNVVDDLAYYKGLIGGVQGTNVGSSLKTGLPMIGKGLMSIVRGAVPGIGFLGGATTGFGASFGVSGSTGGSSPAAGAIVTAGFGATDNSAGSPWTGTHGVHTGMDYAMPIGTPVTSAFNGVVSQVNINADYGTSVMIDNEDGTQAIYGHLSEKEVKVGDKVTEGQRIGRSGKSGNANGPHLHFEVRKGKNNPVDPMSILKGNGTAESMFRNFAKTLPVMGAVIEGSNLLGNIFSTVLSGKMGTKDQQAWAKDFLTRIGAPTSEANIKALNTWMRAEGRGWSTKLNRATYNPLNTTLDRPGAISFNDVGVKAYTSYEQGMEATLATLLGNKADTRGYTAIINALKNDAGVSEILNAINNSGWRTGEVGGAGAYTTFPKGGATTGYGASITPPALSGGNKTVNVNLRIERASEQEAAAFAKKVKYYLEHEEETVQIGRS